MTNVTNSTNQAVDGGVAEPGVVVHQDDAVMHELKARKQEQGDKVNSEQRIIDPADGGMMIEALNLGSGDTSDGVAVPEARKQEQGDKVNSEENRK